MKQTTVETRKTEGKLSYEILVKTSDMPAFLIPVVDVRDGQASRDRAEKMVKQSRVNSGSQFMRPSYSVIGNSYQNSYKH